MTELTALKFQLFSHWQTKKMKMGWKTSKLWGSWGPEASWNRRKGTGLKARKSEFKYQLFLDQCTTLGKYPILPGIFFHRTSFLPVGIILLFLFMMHTWIRITWETSVLKGLIFSGFLNVRCRGSWKFPDITKVLACFISCVRIKLHLHLTFW